MFREDITREEFADVWKEAYDNDHNMQWIADQTGKSKQYVSIKAKRMRAEGYLLPELKSYRRPEARRLENEAVKSRFNKSSAK